VLCMVALTEDVLTKKGGWPFMILPSRSDEVVSDANQKPETLNHKLKHVRRSAIPAH